MSSNVPEAEAAGFELRIEPMGWRVRVPADQPLMAGARTADVDLRSSCRNGTCRSCLCRLVSGEVRYRIEWPGLSADEKREGWILRCVARAVGRRDRCAAGSDLAAGGRVIRRRGTAAGVGDRPGANLRRIDVNV